MHPELFVIPFGPIVVKGYGLLLVLGFTAAILIARRWCRRLGEDPGHILRLAVLNLCFGIVGARLLHVLHNWHTLRDSGVSLFEVRSGGLVFVGGFLLAAVATLVYFRIKRVAPLQFLDILSPAVMVALAFARVGCFLNGCCFGAPSDVPWAVRFPAITYVTEVAEGPDATIPRYGIPFARQLVPDVDRHRPALVELPADYYHGYLNRSGAWVPDRTLVPVEERADFYRSPKPAPRLTPRQQQDLVEGRYRMHPVHPSQLYAVANALMLFVVLNLLFRWRTYRGQVFLWLLLLYGATRFLLEFLRSDTPLELNGLTMTQNVCLTLFPVGAALVWIVRGRTSAGFSR